MTPGQGRVLHLAQRTDASDSPTGEGRRHGLGLVFRRVEADGRNFSTNMVRALEHLSEVGDTFDVDEAVQAGELKTRISLVQDGPGGRILTAPEPGFRGMG